MRLVTILVLMFACSAAPAHPLVRPVVKPAKGVLGAKQMVFEARQTPGILATSRGGAWQAKTQPDGGVVVTNRRQGARPETRTYTFQHDNMLTELKIESSASTRSVSGSALRKAVKGSLSVGIENPSARLDGKVAAMAVRAVNEDRTIVSDHSGLRLTAEPGTAPSSLLGQYERHYEATEERWQRKVTRAKAARERKLNALGVPLVREAPAGLSFAPEAGLRDVNRITPAQLRRLPKGQVLMSTDGNEVIKGVDRLPKTTFYGYLDVGFPASPE